MQTEMSFEDAKRWVSIHAINIEEKRCQKPQHLFVIPDLRKDFAESGKDPAHIGAARFYIVFLLIVPQQRECHNHPPCRVDKKCNHHRNRAGNADCVRAEDQTEARHKRHAASDVSPRIALGGHLIHPLIRRDIHKHGIVENEASGESDFCNYENGKEQNPGPWNRKRRTAEHSHHHEKCKQRLLAVLIVGDRTKHRS